MWILYIHIIVINIYIYILYLLLYWYLSTIYINIWLLSNKVVCVKDVFATSAKIFIVLEFVGGGELFDKIANEGILYILLY